MENVKVGGRLTPDQKTYIYKLYLIHKNCSIVSRISGISDSTVYKHKREGDWDGKIKRLEAQARLKVEAGMQRTEKKSHDEDVSLIAENLQILRTLKKHIFERIKILHENITHEPTIADLVRVMALECEIGGVKKDEVPPDGALTQLIVNYNTVIEKEGPDAIRRHISEQSDRIAELADRIKENRFGGRGSIDSSGQT